MLPWVNQNILSILGRGYLFLMDSIVKSCPSTRIVVAYKMPINFVVSTGVQLWLILGLGCLSISLILLNPINPKLEVKVTPNIWYELLITGFTLVCHSTKISLCINLTIHTIKEINHQLCHLITIFILTQVDFLAP